MTVLLAAATGLLFAIGTYLILQRKLSRIIIGLSLLTHGANILMITSGRRGAPPLVKEGVAVSTFSDPLPQALALTAIVIAFGVTTFLLALAFRSWLLTQDDEVRDDVGDREVAHEEALEEEVDDQARALIDGVGDPEP